jgi:hypothetical protein
VLCGNDNFIAAKSGKNGVKAGQYLGLFGIVPNAETGEHPCFTGYLPRTNQGNSMSCHNLSFDDEQFGRSAAD